MESHLTTDMFIITKTPRVLLFFLTFVIVELKGVDNYRSLIIIFCLLVFHTSYYRLRVISERYTIIGRV